MPTAERQCAEPAPAESATGRRRLRRHPLIFDPDRFSPQNSDGHDRCQYLPFGAGACSCLGNHFATVAATPICARLRRRTCHPPRGGASAATRTSARMRAGIEPELR
ncbi:MULTISPECIES: cytochrome P450 [unclassified Mycolicibacterium]|uniref:cytochrome P450 n=1 Tax=unclassified Mycolicibacterium TaxID=2636767 RepID=UPI0035C956AC